MSLTITPFRIEIPEEDVNDLRWRLVQTRWPEAETVDDWSQGTPLRYARALCEYLGELWQACRRVGAGARRTRGAFRAMGTRG